MTSSFQFSHSPDDASGGEASLEHFSKQGGGINIVCETRTWPKGNVDNKDGL